MYNKTNYNNLISKYIYSDEYKFLDLLKFPIGIYFSLKHLWGELSEMDLTIEVPEVQIPVCFVLGRHDYQVPSECSMAYFEKLIAPQKRIIWFHKSGHTPMFEEPDKFIEIVRKEFDQS